MRFAFLFAVLASCLVAPLDGQVAPPPRIGLIAVTGIPTAYAPGLADALASRWPTSVWTSADAVNTGLRRSAVDVVVLPSGSHFLLETWPALRAFLMAGGHAVFLDGNPLSEAWALDAKGVPKLVDGDTPAWQHDFLIGPGERIPAEGTMTGVDRAFADPIPTISTAYTLTVRFTTKKDFKDEDGTSGPRDALLRPIVQVLDAEGRPTATPLFEIDRLRGDAAGGRWVFWTGDRPLPTDTVVSLVGRAARGAMRLDAIVSPVIVEPGTGPTLRISLHRPGRTLPAEVSARVVDRGDPNAAPIPVVLRGGEWMWGTIGLPPGTKPGLRALRISADGVDPESIETGFEVRDAALRARAPVIAASRDWLTKDGRPWPVVGTTYMDSEIHRKFLFEPNPARWEADFAWMKSEGVNYVRTGFWTAWQRAMLDSGAVDPSILDALEAYVQVAARNDIVVCFNFFAFTPPLFGGSHPYLDPRALEGQSALIAAFVSRFRDNGWVHWDLINEPSYCPPDQLWTHRPIGDRHEKAAWNDWIATRWSGESPERIRARWQDPATAGLDVPRVEDLAWAMVRDGKLPRKAVDFGRFTNTVVARWAAALRDVIRAAENPKAPRALVTLGQDEGGTDVRPSQLLMAGSLDYTSLHNWWQNDDLLFDAIVTKADIPSLVQESGLMRAEDSEGRPLRTPEDAARLLERKYAWSFAGGACGVVQWAWNVNPFMPIDNESVIGFVRPDGSMKPEARVSRTHARFWNAVAPYLGDARPSDVAIVIPHSRLFLGRPEKLLAVKRVVRTLAYDLGVVPKAYSEWTLSPTDAGVAMLTRHRLVVVPTPEVLDEDAARTLVAAARRGTRILLTGGLEGDPYGELSPAHVELGAGATRPVAMREPTMSAHHAATGRATFDNRFGEWLRVPVATPAIPKDLPVMREPIPVEFAREPELLGATLKAAATLAGIPETAAPKHAARVSVDFEKGRLWIVVNESATADSVTLPGVKGEESIRVEAGRAHLRFVGREAPPRVIDIETGE